MRKLFVAGVVVLTGCASIVGEKTQTFTFNSNPSGAVVEVSNKAGTPVFRGTTPASITLPKSTGYFAGETYTAKFVKDGYEAQSTTLDSHPGGWYLAGNLLFGGLIGWFIVDPVTGAMWSFDQPITNAVLPESKPRPQS